MANKKHVRLNTARDVHKLLSMVINERRRGEVDSAECRDIGYLAKILLESMDAGINEERIDIIEKKLKEDYHNEY